MAASVCISDFPLPSMVGRDRDSIPSGAFLLRAAMAPRALTMARCLRIPTLSSFATNATTPENGTAERSQLPNRSCRCFRWVVVHCAESLVEVLCIEAEVGTLYKYFGGPLGPAVRFVPSAAPGPLPIGDLGESTTFSGVTPHYPDRGPWRPP